MFTAIRAHFEHAHFCPVDRLWIIDPSDISTPARSKRRREALALKRSECLSWRYLGRHLLVIFCPYRSIERITLENHWKFRVIFFGSLENWIIFFRHWKISQNLRPKQMRRSPPGFQPTQDRRTPQDRVPSDRPWHTMHHDTQAHSCRAWIITLAHSLQGKSVV